MDTEFDPWKFIINKFIIKSSSYIVHTWCKNISQFQLATSYLWSKSTTITVFRNINRTCQSKLLTVNIIQKINKKIDQLAKFVHQYKFINQQFNKRLELMEKLKLKFWNLPHCTYQRLYSLLLRLKFKTLEDNKKH